LVVSETTALLVTDHTNPVPHGTQLVDDGAHFDFIIVGSGFGGSVSALRLAQKGYSVLVLEKGRRLGPDDFPRTNWNLKRWLWMPSLGFRGLFKMTFFRHLTAFTGVGVGGGSLTYGNTLPHPPDAFFQSPSWAHLGDWKDELAPHYDEARRMLGVDRQPVETLSDRILREIAVDLGREEHFEFNPVSVYFGEPKVTVPDPYFEGQGPERTGCRFCGACFTGCRYGAKNTLDFNYLYLAERLGVRIQPDTMVKAIRPRKEGGYRIEASLRRGWLRHTRLGFTADRVVLAGGAMGTNDLLLQLKADPEGLPKLSDRLGDKILSNHEALIGAETSRNDLDMTEGIAITSILQTDDVSHVEPFRYGSGSGFFRLLIGPHATGDNVFTRLVSAARNFLRHPLRWTWILLQPNWARHSLLLLYMRAYDSTLSVVHGRSPLTLFARGLHTRLGGGNPPKASMPEATDLAERTAEKIDGVTGSLLTETLFNIPSTAHFLGGCNMGTSAEDGVIDAQHRVFGYDGLYICDGSAMTANPGVNPSLTITAMTERAMSLIPAKEALSAEA
jgi:cholesterol oxidase